MRSLSRSLHLAIVEATGPRDSLPPSLSRYPFYPLTFLSFHPLRFDSSFRLFVWRWFPVSWQVAARPAIRACTNNCVFELSFPTLNGRRVVSPFFVQPTVESVSRKILSSRRLPSGGNPTEFNGRFQWTVEGKDTWKATPRATSDTSKIVSSYASSIFHFSLPTLYLFLALFSVYYISFASFIYLFFQFFFFFFFVSFVFHSNSFFARINPVASNLLVMRGKFIKSENPRDWVFKRACRVRIACVRVRARARVCVCVCVYVFRVARV